MKYLSTTLLSIFLLATSFAQTVDNTLGTIDVQGSSKILANPPNFIAQILIEEEEQKAGYATIGKVSIDTIKINLFANLKKFGIDGKELQLLATSSKAIGQYPNSLTNISYELKLKDRETGNKLVNELRFTGLKGVVIRREFTQDQKNILADSLYNSAIDDAKRIAKALAKKENKSIGEIKIIELRSNSMKTNVYNDDIYNSFAYYKFEMDYRDKFATCFVRVVFEMK